MTDGGLDGIDAWLAEQRADAAIEERRRAGWLQRRAEEAATLAGALVVAAEQATPVVLMTTGGRVHRGVVSVVGDDAVAMRTGRGTVLASLHAVATVRPEPERGRDARRLVDDERTGSRPGLTLLAMLDEAVAQRAAVAVVVLGAAEALAGTLVSVGADVLTLEPGPVVVARHAVSEVLLAG